MSYNYLLKAINDTTNIKNREILNESKSSDLLFIQKKRKSEQSFLDFQWNCMTPKKELEFSFLKQYAAKSENNIFTSKQNGFSNYNSSTGLSFDYNNKEQKFRYNSPKQIENLIKNIINSNNENQKKNSEQIDFDFHEKLYKKEKKDIAKSTEISKLENVKDNNFIENNYGKKNAEYNNKLVYSNSKETDLYHYSNDFEQSKKIFLIDVGRRRSKYKGVSKNGNQWQVLVMINKNKSYVGTYPTEDLAARIYDIFVIKSKGDKAKTNFIYSESQIRKICNAHIDIKSNNLNQIISELLKED